MKAVRLFPELYNIKDFIVTSHPEHHPDSTAYLRYWETQDKYCVEGKWGEDSRGNKGGWRYMPPFLYYYVNFCVIDDEDEKGNTTRKIRPMLRDVEWLMSYGWLTCRGFSGFEEDEKYTSHRLVKKIEEEGVLSLTEKETRTLDRIKDSILLPDGSGYKKYVESREYLYRTHKKPLGRPYYYNEALNFFVLGSRGFGKDVMSSEVVHYEDGPKPISQVKLGDRIYGRDGRLTTVISRKDFNDQIQYKVTFKDGRSLTTGAGHLWTVFNTVSRKWETKELRSIMEDYLIEYSSGRIDHRYFIPYCEKIEYPEKNLPIDPYFLGLWLGDGSKHRTSVTSVDEEIVESIYSYADHLDHQVSINQNTTKTCPDYLISEGYLGNGESSKLRKEFKELNLLNNKHIPEIYKFSSVEQRMELIRGLLDSDGYINKEGNIEFTSSIPQLSKDTVMILDSLGIRNKTKLKETGFKTAYRTLILTSEKVFKLSRKKERLNFSPSAYAQANRERVAISHIEVLGVEPSVCIGVDNEDSLFVAGDRYVVTHNSFFCGNAVLGHEYNFFGKKYFDESYLHNPDPIEIFVGSALAAKSSDLLKKFEATQEYLTKHYGSWGSGDDFIPGYFYTNNSGTLTPNNSKSPYRHEYKEQVGNTWVTQGTGTKLLHGVYTAENPQAAVGTRPTVMVIEEVGLLGNLLDVHAANETCQIRRTKFGSSFYIGTGGNMEKIIESKIVFEDPEAYNFLPYKDHWENRVKPIGFFLPAYYVDNSFKDEQGNTDVDAALREEEMQRKRREKAATSSALDGYMMARPIVPSEMFLSPTANIFPTAKIRQREAEVLSKNLFELNASIGTLHWSKEKDHVLWQEDISRNLKPIRTLNLDSYKGDISGAIVIYEHPPDEIPNPTQRRSLYKIVYDPVKDDNGGTSLASILVYKGFVQGNWNGGIQDGIVAEYIGRYDQVNDIHEIAIKLAYYYNAKVLVENNVPDFIRYCKMEKRSHILQMSPYEAISVAIKNPTKRYDVGVRMTKQLNVHCEILIRQWLLETWNITHDGRVLTNIDKILSLRLLQELIAYERELNFDHVSALKLLVLWLSQESIRPMDERMDNVKPVKDMDKFINRRRSYLTQNNPFHAY